MLCRLGLREHLNEDIEPTLGIRLYKSVQARSIYTSKSIGRIVAAADRMNRDTTCRSMRPLLSSRNGEACTVRGSASLQAESTRGPARSIHEGFYCNRRYAAATSLMAAGSPLGRSTYCSSMPLSLAAPRARLACVSAVSSRTLVNTAG